MSLFTTLHSLQSLKCDVGWEHASSFISQEGIAISKLPHLFECKHDLSLQTGEMWMLKE